jgi:hypothetical protein
MAAAPWPRRHAQLQHPYWRAEAGGYGDGMSRRGTASNSSTACNINACYNTAAPIFAAALISDINSRPAFLLFCA